MLTGEGIDKLFRICEYLQNTYGADASFDARYLISQVYYANRA